MLVKMDNIGYIRIDEGTGDNLLDEDIAEGYVDYIYYDIYKDYLDVESDNSDDGGMYLLRKPYVDMFNSAKEVVDYLIDHDELPNYDYVFIEL